MMLFTLLFFIISFQMNTPGEQDEINFIIQFENVKKFNFF